MKKNPHSKLLLLTAAVMLTVLLGGSAGIAGSEQRSASLKIALLPIPDVLPFHVARDKGYFRQEGISVEGLPVFSSLDRDQLMQAGQLDAMLTELATTANFNRNGVRVRIVTIARTPIADHSLFRILAAPNTGIRSISDLAGTSLGISKNTVIEYVTDRLLAAGGLDPAKTIKKSVPVIPERYQLLMQGQIKAATLPEPLASSALAGGAMQIVADSENPRYSVSVISFSMETLLNKGAAVKAFLRAWSRAAADINAAPEAYRRVMLAALRVPDNVRQHFPVPLFPPPRIPDKTQWTDVMNWLISKKLLTKPLPYEDSVTAAYLPGK